MKRVQVSIYPISMRIVSLAARRRHVTDAIARAAEVGSKLICFPEYTPYRRTTEACADLNAPYYRLAETWPDGDFTAMMQAACAKHRIGAVYGTVAHADDGQCYNYFASLSKTGKLLGAYGKTHLAPGEDTQEKLAPGQKLHLLPTEIGPAGVITCYEILFPEIALTHRTAGARFLIHPTAGQFTFQARTRAFETQMPMLYSCYAPLKRHPDEWGAAIIDTKGKVIAKTAMGTRLVTAEIDVDPPVQSPTWDGKTKKVDMRKFVYARRRPELYVL